MLLCSIFFGFSSHSPALPLSLFLSLSLSFSFLSSKLFSSIFHLVLGLFSRSPIHGFLVQNVICHLFLICFKENKHTKKKHDKLNDTFLDSHRIREPNNSELYGNFTASFTMCLFHSCLSSLRFHCVPRKRYTFRAYMEDEQWNVSSKHEIKIEWLFALNTARERESERMERARGKKTQRNKKRDHNGVVKMPHIRDHKDIDDENNVTVIEFATGSLREKKNRWGTLEQVYLFIQMFAVFWQTKIKFGLVNLFLRIWQWRILH